MTAFLQIESFKNVEHFNKDDPTGTRRAHRNKIIAAIGTGHRRSLHCQIAHQIIVVHNAAIPLHLGNDAFCRLAAVETVPPLPFYKVQCRRQIILTKCVTEANGPLVPRKNLQARGESFKRFVPVRELASKESVSDDKSASGDRKSTRL